MKTLFRTLMMALAGAFAAALIAKMTLKSKGDQSTEEIDLVTIVGGQEIVSSADPFYGGKVLTLFGGTLLDLRKAQPAPTGVHLDLAIVMGGFSLVVPSGWKVEFVGDLLGGGYDDATHPTSDPDAPIVRVTGRIIFGGFQATTRSPVEVVA